MLKWLVFGFIGFVVYMAFQQGVVKVDDTNDGFGISIRKQLPVLNPWSKKVNVNAGSFQAPPSNLIISSSGDATRNTGLTGLPVTTGGWSNQSDSGYYS